jgi:hypothetical protein
MDSLVFYDKEGNSLNFNYNSSLERYEGDILFHENSNDTFKTQAIYMFEKIKGFEYENQSDLTLRRWQLFNEFGFKFFNSSSVGQIISYIEPINNNPTFFSKWIYGDLFDEKFPIGTLIKFDDQILEFTNLNQTYTVISSKKNAILINSNVDNKTFTSVFPYQTFPYVSKTISSINAIGVYNYYDLIGFNQTLSTWNERDFFTRIYNNRKLNIVNSKLNDSFSKTGNFDDVTVVTVNNNLLLDNIYFEYVCLSSSVNQNLTISVELKTDLPIIYSGGLQFNSLLSIGSNVFNNVIQFSGQVPVILKPGVEFIVPDSILNTANFRISSIPNFIGNANKVTYLEGQQVIWNNRIYQCVQEYTWVANQTLVDLALPIPFDIATPDDSNYWSEPTYLSLDGIVSTEVLLGVDLYVVQNIFYFEQEYLLSPQITLASAVDRFKVDLDLLNINLEYDFTLGKATATLEYPSQWAIVNFLGWTGSFSPITSTLLSSVEQVNERVIGIEENLNFENNLDISQNFNYNIVFTDLDEFGMIIKINGQIYQKEVQFVFSSGQIDMPRTIHKTLLSWQSDYNFSLLSLGIVSKLQTIGSGVWFNSINLTTDYPNVPLDFSIQVGITGDFYIEKSKLVFYEPSQLALSIGTGSPYSGLSFSLGNFIDIRVNGRSYGITHSFPDPISSISQTLQNWIDEYSLILDDFGIFVTNDTSSLNFNLKDFKQRCDIEVRVASSVLSGDRNYQIVDKFVGNHGTLLTSNEIILSTYSVGSSLEDVGFSTGMVTGINGTLYPLQNIEYNVLLLDPGVINLSYEGPFWGLTSGICSNSPFTIVAFSSGFTQSLCLPGPTSGAGHFNAQQFTQSFYIFSSSTTTYSSNTFTGISGMVDLVHLSTTGNIFVFGDNIVVFDSINGNQITTINLPGNSDSLKIIYNSVDNYIWALSENILWQIDPNNLSIKTQYSILNQAYSIGYNSNNGDVYVTTNNDIRIYSDSIGLITTIIQPAFDLVFNQFENSMYVAARDGSTLFRINGTTRLIQNSYSVAGLTGDGLLYESFSDSIYVFGTNLNIVDNGVVNPMSQSSGILNTLSYNPIRSGVQVSVPNEFSLLDEVNYSLLYSSLTPIFGFQDVNLYDGDVYVSNQNSSSPPGLYVFDSLGGNINHFVSTGQTSSELIYNPDRNSIWVLVPSLNQIVEVVPNITFTFNPISLTFSGTTGNYYGTLDSGYIDRNYLWLHTQDFIRRPRQNFNDDVPVSLYWKWLSDNVSEFFLYDFSGDLLPTTGRLAYNGTKPLPKVNLNRNANRDLDKVSLSEYQQTIFPIIEHELSYVDDLDDITAYSEPIETFIGFNSSLEGGLRSILQLFKKESVDFKINTFVDISDKIKFETVYDNDENPLYGLISLDLNSNSNFLFDSNGVKRGLKPNQHLAIFIKDETNIKNQYISKNNGYLVRITDIFFKQIKVEFFKSIDRFFEEETIINNYPSNGRTTLLSVRFKVWDKELGRFNVYGETEIEDIRFKIELGNVGKLISSDDVYIFKEYDIKEEGIDWIFLNRKRKEMLMMKSLIYPYIGSYKAIINSINYFGYNDLELYEYYRNINFNSPNFNKLFKVEIPDIFDLSSPGWSEKDFIKQTFPNPNYEDTRLFNLTFRITDRDGNNILTYSLEEVQKKLNGLKYWLEKNVIPITHKILDITGRADFRGDATINHIVRDVNIIRHYEVFTPVSFKLNELYLMPVNNGSTVYNCVLDFYLTNNNYNPYSGIKSSTLPDTYTVNIKTYQIYREWYPFKSYLSGDKVVYFGKLYESVFGDSVNPNLTNNPRKYENVSDWQIGNIYNISDIVRYDRDFYIYAQYGSTSPTASVITPFLDSGGTMSNWLNITEWKEIDLSPIQTITEVRRIDNLNPFNFTIDSNIDPYLVIEVTSDNGYGAIYRDKKNYEIRGILDIRELESYTNLTSKQYTKSVIGLIYTGQ